MCVLTNAGVRQYYRHLPFQPLAQKVFEQKCAALIDLLSSVDFHQCLVFSNYQLRSVVYSHNLNRKVRLVSR